MALGVALSELRRELRAEIYSSLSTAVGINAIDLQNVLLARVQRQLWNEYVWPHLTYRIDFTQPAQQKYITYDATMPFENVRSLWYNQTYMTGYQAVWRQLVYGFEDSINETLIAWPPMRWRNNAVVNTSTQLTQIGGQAQLWPIPVQSCPMRWLGQAPLNPLAVDTDPCMIDSTAIVLTAAAELLGQQKSEVASLKGNMAQAYIRRLLGRSGANKRPIKPLGQGDAWVKVATPYIDYIPGP
jgi:hypothetical protein